MYSYLSRHLAALTLSSVALLTGCMHMSAPSNLDYSRTRSSEHGIYRAAIKPDGDSIPQGKLQKWTLHLDAASGAPVSAARVAVDGGMNSSGTCRSYQYGVPWPVPRALPIQPSASRNSTPYALKSAAKRPG